MQVYLGGLTSNFGAIRTVICTRENTPFFDLQSMLLVQEKHAGVSMSADTDNKMLYIEEDRRSGRGGRGGLVLGMWRSLVRKHYNIYVEEWWVQVLKLIHRVREREI